MELIHFSCFFVCLQPYAVLAAIVISAVLVVADFGEAVYLWKVHKLDFLTWCVSFLCTILFGVQIGLASAIILSLLITQYESAYPHTAVLGRLPGTTVYRNVKQYPATEQYQGMVICRFDAPLYFANSQYIIEVSRDLSCYVRSVIIVWRVSR